MANERELAEFIYIRLSEIPADDIDNAEAAIATIESAINEFKARDKQATEPEGEGA